MVKLNDMSEDEIKDLFMEVYKKVQTDLPKVLEETGISELFGSNTSNYDKYNLDDDTDINDDDYDSEYDDSDIETLDEE